MNKAELVNKIAQATGQTKLEVQNTVAAILHQLTNAMAKGERVTLVGFGTFERRQRQARMGVNPQNPDEKLKIPSARVPVFRAGQDLKLIVDGKKRLPALAKAAKAAKKTATAKKAKSSARKTKASAKPKKAAKAKPKKSAARSKTTRSRSVAKKTTKSRASSTRKKTSTRGRRR